MRINVYAEQLPSLLSTTTARDIEVVEREVDGRRFFAIRLFLQSSPMLHNTEKDDDRSAITFWVPWTHQEGNNFEKLCVLFSALHTRARRLSDLMRADPNAKLVQ